MKGNNWPCCFSRNKSQIITELPPCFTVVWSGTEWNTSFGYHQTYTRLVIGNKENDDSSEKITLFHCLRNQFQWAIHFETFFWRSRGFRIATLFENVSLCNSWRRVFMNTRFWRCLLSLEIIVRFLVLCCFLKIRYVDRRSLSDNFDFRPELCSVEDVFFCF